MSASTEMPYFIKPSTSFSREEKEAAYAQVRDEIKLLLDSNSSEVTKMATVNCLLKTHLPYFFWVGFYLVHNGRLEVGPYQGTLGCLYIDLDKGVCGKAATQKKTQIVVDCHALVQGSEHIACDPNSRSEIVVPVFNTKHDLVGVFDVDSTLKGSFDEVDQKWLEKIMEDTFSS